VSVPVPAASVVLARVAGGDELFLVRRADNLRFFGGFAAFPGGKVDADDLSRETALIRELFEETGVLLARRADGSFPSADLLPPLRRDLLEGRLTFADLLARLEVIAAAAELRSVGHLVTPPFSTFRFDTAFYVAVLPPGQSAEVWPGELSDGQWISADGALSSWERGERLLSPPSVALLEAIRGRPVEELPQRAGPLLAGVHDDSLPTIWFSPGVRLLPLRCDGLPPATYTNAVLIGTGPRYLIDSGPTDPHEQAKLFAVLDSDAAAGQRLTGVVLTHHHPDHIGAVKATAERYGVPVWAHPWTAKALKDRITVTHLLDEGDRLDLGPAPHGSGRWEMEALHTPGHAPGHLIFWEPSYRLLLVGDLVSALSSVVIVPPDGDLTQYLASLERARRLPARLLIPAHGSPTARCDKILADALEHRLQREEQLLAALAHGPRRLSELTAELYRGLPNELVRLAEAQTLAGLLKLQGEGRAVRDGDQWSVQPI
jgi:glyoxylase-like metal-dependent hydrolase (beta-lactamase superfamily II)/8-oxo-dGTP pyrophosphatase MutT (NUDIX family)